MGKTTRRTGRSSKTPGGSSGRRSCSPAYRGCSRRGWSPTPWARWGAGARGGVVGGGGGGGGALETEEGRGDAGGGGGGGGGGVRDCRQRPVPGAGGGAGDGSGSGQGAALRHPGVGRGDDHRGF